MWKLSTRFDVGREANVDWLRRVACGSSKPPASRFLCTSSIQILDRNFDFVLLVPSIFSKFGRIALLNKIALRKLRSNDSWSLKHVDLLALINVIQRDTLHNVLTLLRSLEFQTVMDHQNVLVREQVQCNRLTET